MPADDQQVGYLLVMVLGLVALCLPAAFGLIYVVFGLPTLWELDRRRRSDSL
jgi:hypothetical protein